MDKQQITTLTNNFEDYKQEKDGVEFWFARDLQKLLEYKEWRNFELVIEKAKISCEASKFKACDHFVDVNKTIKMPKGATKEVNDTMLTRYACYLIAQNGDPRKESIAFAQTYFAIQTRKQEILEEQLAIQERLQARKKLTETEKQLSHIIYQRGVDNKGFGRIRAKGDEALFGGCDTKSMKSKLDVPDKRPLADFLPTITIKAKDFTTEITNFNVIKEDMRGEYKITNEHVKNNTDVRNLLVKKDIYPEELPPADDIKKIDRKSKSGAKELAKNKVLSKIQSSEE